MKHRQRNRTASVIADEIRVALKHEASDVFRIGSLLAEARTQFEHGRWLPWLHKEFSMSQRTAYRYLSVHELRPKLKVASLANLTTTALYWLSDADLETKELDAVSQAATKRWIGATEARAIVASLRAPQPPEEPLDVDPYDAPESAPEEPPALPPPAAPAPLPLDAYLTNEFTTAIRTLMKLCTKPSAKFVDAITTADLQMVANFINGIAVAQSKMRAEK
jgi:Protein of unknown function (DUF3102)